MNTTWKSFQPTDSHVNFNICHTVRINELDQNSNERVNELHLTACDPPASGLALYLNPPSQIMSSIGVHRTISNWQTHKVAASVYPQNPSQCSVHNYPNYINFLQNVVQIKTGGTYLSLGLHSTSCEQIIPFVQIDFEGTVASPDTNFVIIYK